MAVSIAKRFASLIQADRGSTRRNAARKRTILFDRLEERTVLSTLIVNPANTCSYRSIQDAVNAAVANDTIQIAPGNYAEDVTVTKPLKLDGLNDGPATGVNLNSLTINLSQYTKLTLDGQLNVSKNLTIGNPSQKGIVLSGGTIAVAGDINANNAYTEGSTMILVNGSGSQALAGTASGIPGRLPALTIAKPTNSPLTITGNVGVVADAGLTYTSGVVNASASTIYLLPIQYHTQALDAQGMSFGNVVVQEGPSTRCRPRATLTSMEASRWSARPPTVPSRSWPRP